MAIATLDQALAGMRPGVRFHKQATPTLVAGRSHSLWYLTGNPGPGTMDAATAGGSQLVSSSALVPGQLRHYDPGAGNSYLARFLAQSSAQPGQLLLCDRLWHGSNLSAGVLSVTSTAAQAIGGFPGLPARDDNASANGVGVLAAVEVYAALGSGTPTWTLTYTNSDGTTGKTGTNTDPVVASSPIGTFHPFNLAAGDVGVRAPTSFQSSATSTSGNFGLVLYRVLAEVGFVATGVPDVVDALTSGFTRLPNGCVPFLVFVPSATAATQINGRYVETQG